MSLPTKANGEFVVKMAPGPWKLMLLDQPFSHEVFVEAGANVDLGELVVGTEPDVVELAREAPVPAE